MSLLDITNVGSEMQ